MNLSKQVKYAILTNWQRRLYAGKIMKLAFGKLRAGTSFGL